MCLQIQNVSKVSSLMLEHVQQRASGGLLLVSRACADRFRAAVLLTHKDASASTSTKTRLFSALLATAIITVAAATLPDCDDDCVQYVTILAEECAELAGVFSTILEGAASDGMPTEPSGFVIANEAVVETVFDVSLTKGGHSKEANIQGRQIRLAFEGECIKLCAALPYAVYGCSYRYKYAGLGFTLHFYFFAV